MSFPPKYLIVFSRLRYLAEWRTNSANCLQLMANCFNCDISVDRSLWLELFQPLRFTEEAYLNRKGIDIARYRRPTPQQIKAVMRLMKPWRWLANPAFSGFSNVPSQRPLLFVGNHTLFGVLDVPFFFAELYQRHDIFLRALADHAHFKVPFWRSFLAKFGAVDGTRENCRRLMKAKESILVFPGGGREVAKRKGEKYKLIWKNRLGFARMAIRYHCTIVPFSAVGVEDAFDIVLDADDLMRTPFGKVIETLHIRDAIIPPVAKGIGPTMLPRPQRLYFHISEPITWQRGDYCYDNLDHCRELRNRVRSSVEEGISELLRRQTDDPERVRFEKLIHLIDP